jgi:O6-methylguanine-DNA--protein-cysteine methyltransferase
LGVAIGGDNQFAQAFQWFIPCHRVLPSDGGIGDYYLGPRRKKTMLAFEAARSL